MSRLCDHQRRGFVLLELLVALSIGALGVVLATGILSVSDTLARESREDLRMAAEYREAHAAIAAELRNAALDTLDGFDADGVATEPKFKRVTGIVDNDLTYSPEFELKYEDYPGKLKSGTITSVPGLGSGEIGEIVLISGGSIQRVLVRMVIKDSFQVRQEGRNLIIRLSILSGVHNERSMQVATGETVVSLRN